MNIKSWIVVGLIIFLSILLYGRFQIEKEEVKINAEAANIVGRLNCQREAVGSYLAQWNAQCGMRGLKNECFLPSFVAEKLGKDLTNEKKLCVETFK